MSSCGMLNCSVVDFLASSSKTLSRVSPCTASSSSRGGSLCSPSSQHHEWRDMAGWRTREERTWGLAGCGGSVRLPKGFRVYCEGGSGAGGVLSSEEWTRKLPAKRKALYSHSLPCIEAWLQSLGFRQGKDDRALWNIERPDWHAELSLDITDLYIRYLKSGPGNLDRDVERKFSYALSREDLENAILGGP